MTVTGDAENAEAGAAPEEGVPCCTGCARPYVRGQYYCTHCGTGVGNITPYVPYVNIRFNYGPFAGIWQGLKGDGEIGYGRWIVYVVIVLLVWPIVLIALPFMLAEWLRAGRARKGAADPRDDNAETGGNHNVE